MLLIDTDTRYETLLTAFPKLNSELEEVDPNLLFDSQQVFKFLPNDMFKETLPKDHLLKNLLDISRQYKDDILTILRICFVKFLRGFEKQKGAIFGVGTVQDDDTESVMKISFKILLY